MVCKILACDHQTGQRLDRKSPLFEDVSRAVIHFTVICRTDEFRKPNTTFTKWKNHQDDPPLQNILQLS